MPQTDSTSSEKPAADEQPTASGRADQLDLARNIILVTICIIGLVLLALSVDILVRGRADSGPTERVIEALGLTNLAVVPSGRPLRHPLLQNRAVDLRHDPSLSPTPDPTQLILTAPRTPDMGSSP